MKAKYTKKQILESIKYWKKQLNAMNESNDYIVIRLIDNEDGHNSTRNSYACNMSSLKEKLHKINNEFNIYENSDLNDLVGDLKTSGYVDCEDYGGDSWSLEILTPIKL